MNELSHKIPAPSWRLTFEEQIRNSQDDAKAAGFTNTNLYSARACKIRQGLSECFKDHTSNILLDIGCNRGHFADDLARYAAQTIGLDFASAAPRYCKDNNRYTYQIEANGEHLPFPSESIDSCVLLDSLTSTDDFTALICEACRILRPGGKIFIETLRHCGLLIEILRCARATCRDLRRKPLSSALFIDSIKRTFRPRVCTLTINRPSSRQLHAALRAGGIKHITIRERRLFGIFPGERTIVFGQKGVSGNAKNASLR